MILAGTVFDDGDTALFLAIAAGVVVVFPSLVFLLGWVGGRTLRK